MKSTPRAAFAVLTRALILASITAAFCALSPAPASAQAPASRADIFTVTGIQVDETAPNATAAQTQGFASASRIGFERLARRLTTAQDQQRIGMPTPDAASLERLAISVDVESERRSATRYIARLTVRFDPEGVRAALRQAGYATVVETRTAPVLIVPQGDASLPPETLGAWRSAWSEGGFAEELVPLAVAPAGASGGDWTTLYPFAQAQGATSAIVASVRVQGNSATATLREVTTAGVRDRGSVSANVTAADAGALRAALTSLALQTSAMIQNDWKSRNSGASTQTVQRGRMSASVRYANQHEWEQVKNALEAAASTLISEIRIEAVARDGALVSFSFVGDRAQLAAELNRRGVSLQDSPYGPVLQTATRGH